MKRVIVFDVDNTLAAVGKGMLDEDILLLKELEDQGNTIAVCSGKPSYYLCGFMRQIGLKHPVLIGENGSTIQFGVDLPPKNYYIQSYSQEAGETIRFFKEKIREKIPKMFFQPNEICLTPFPADRKEYDLIGQCLEEYKDHVKDVTVYPQSDCYDIVPNGISKGSGLELLCRILGEEKEDLTAVGDGINDYPMFETAGEALGVNVADESKVDRNFKTIREVLLYLLDRK